MGLSPAAKERASIVFNICRVTFHYGFIPTILYLGFKKGSDNGMPPLRIFNLLWQ
ncbi:mitochondrial import receptor subunit TOM7 homolog [Ctenocephalides felis]|uniref:mitochondrial import receptor subunit TOM7 homolog n=1 Tax=Ctenocephalides felis TaxID=7515 RepID=UPI000E6E235E|nr:mitochondrial import receptor subunit TOM7 homolog [Ctenocephalides felis]XP_026480562.1 mitochondrial import receptor subunit TOM7 homolog [Ctenocephalides felis]